MLRASISNELCMEWNEYIYRRGKRVGTMLATVHLPPVIGSSTRSIPKHLALVRLTGTSYWNKTFLIIY